MAIYATSGGSGSAVEVITVNTSGAYVSGGGGGGGGGNVNLTEINGVTVAAGAGNSSTGTQRVVIASDQAAVAVSAASLPLPSGASTAAKQPALGTAGTASADVITVQGVASMTPLSVTVGTALPTGTNGIGSVTVTGIDYNSGNVGATTQRVAIATDQVRLSNPMPTGVLLTNPSANFTRPSDTSVYASGDLVANSVTAGSVTPLSFTFAAVAGGTGVISKARLHKSDNDITGAAFKLHLFTASPTIATTGDNGVFATVVSGSATWVGSMSIGAMLAMADGNVGNGAADTGSDMRIDLSSGTTLYGLLEARGAYTPASAEVFTVTLEVIQN